MFKFINKKIIVVVLIFSMVSSFLTPVFLVKKAEAVLPVIDAAVIAAISSMAASQPVREVASKTLISRVIDLFWEAFKIRLFKVVRVYVVDLVVNGGKGGKSLIVANFGNLWENTANDTLNAFLKETTRDGKDYYAFCEPFSFQVRNALVGWDDRLNYSCTIDSIVGNIEAFYQDFTYGGWAGFSAQLDDRNNPYGSYFNFRDEAIIRMYNAVASKQAQINDGFEATESCAYGFEIDGIDVNGDGAIANDCYIQKITTPGAVIASQLNNALNFPVQGIFNAKELTQWLALVFDEIAFGLFAKGFAGMIGSGEGLHSVSIDSFNTTYLCNDALAICTPRFAGEYPVDPSAGIYRTAEECDNQCGAGEEDGAFNTNAQACSAGVFVRGRPPGDCDGGECNRCTGIGGASAQDSCFVFCKHTKDVEWRVGAGNGRDYSQAEVEPVVSFFGLSAPASGCSCSAVKNQLPFYNNPDVGKFGSICFDCGDSVERTGYLCRKTTWCETGPTPTPEPSESPTPEPTPEPEVECCYGLADTTGAVYECIVAATEPNKVCTLKDGETIVSCYRSYCAATPTEEFGRCQIDGKFTGCIRIEKEPNSICKTLGIPTALFPCDNNFTPQ